jgi:hypothetical protein
LLMILLRLPAGKGIPLAARWMLWGLETFTTPPYGTLLKLEARGIKHSNPHMMEIIAYHKDGYEFTAIPTTACLLQYLDGTIREPGLWLQGTLVEPMRFMRDIERMGVELQIRHLTPGTTTLRKE